MYYREINVKRKRRHHNTKGVRQIKRGKTHDQGDIERQLKRQRDAVERADSIMRKHLNSDAVRPLKWMLLRSDIASAIIGEPFIIVVGPAQRYIHCGGTVWESAAWRVEHGVKDE